MRSLGFALPNRPRQKHNRLNVCRRGLVGELNSTRRRLRELARQGPAGKLDPQRRCSQTCFLAGSGATMLSSGRDAVRPSTPYASPRLSDSNAARLGRGEQPADVVRRVSARVRDCDSDSKPREPRPNRRTVNRRQPGAELSYEQPGALATPGRRHLRTRKPPGGGSLTARISCVAGEPRPRRPTIRW